MENIFVKLEKSFVKTEYIGETRYKRRFWFNSY